VFSAFQDFLKDFKTIYIMGMFQRPSFASGQEGASDSQHASSHHPHRSSLISSRPSSSSVSFRHSSRYSSTALDTEIGNEVNAPNSRLGRFLCGCCGGNGHCHKPGCMEPNSAVSINSKKIIRSRVWKLLMIFFYSFVLFGSQVHDLWSPLEDVAFNILSLITFGFCILEMGLRIVAEPNYFQFGIASFWQSRIYIFGGNDNNNTCSFGSFLFWCDLVSTGVLLIDISWINKKSFAEQVIEIELDSFGFPVRSFCTSRQAFNQSARRVLVFAHSLLCHFCYCFDTGRCRGSTTPSAYDR
jgi:hypothetical protein